MKVETAAVIICIICLIAITAFLPNAIDQWFQIGEYAK